MSNEKQRSPCRALKEAPALLHFAVRIDQASSLWLLNFRELEGQTSRQQESLCEYYFGCAQRGKNRP